MRTDETRQKRKETRDFETRGKKEREINNRKSEENSEGTVQKKKVTESNVQEGCSEQLVRYPHFSSSSGDPKKSDGSSSSS